LDRACRAKVIASFERIEEGGELPASLFCKMSGTSDLWEVRVKHSGDIFRFICFMDKGRLVVVLSGFQKKTQKTPSKEIATATQRKKDYLKRKK
jgi:phage-related protein